MSDELSYGATIRCPECKGVSKVDSDVLGKRVRCEHCKHSHVAVEAGVKTLAEYVDAYGPSKPARWPSSQWRIAAALEEIASTAHLVKLLLEAAMLLAVATAILYILFGGNR